MKKKWLYGIIAVLLAVVIGGGIAISRNKAEDTKPEDTAPDTAAVAVTDIEI